ncbi:DUF2140 domain-containing protein, partial [Lactiplantibacillus plantarum]|nr:DUF2140 domain-containing protein [Lactiplantibacillus plantarum]
MREAQLNKQASASINPKTNGTINVWKCVADVLIAMIVGPGAYVGTQVSRSPCDSASLTAA